MISLSGMRTIFLFAAGAVWAFFSHLGLALVPQPSAVPETSNAAASALFPERVSAAEVKGAYRAAPVSGKRLAIMIVPGHDNRIPGAVYRNLREADLVLSIGTRLAALLSGDPRFQVILARSDSGYNQTIQGFLDSNSARIQDFIKANHAVMAASLRDGAIEPSAGPAHQTAPDEVVSRLYGFNLFANDNRIPLVVHLHLDDYASHPRGEPGEFSGFSVYVPDSQYGNADLGRALGQSIARALAALYPESNQPAEQRAMEANGGVVPDQELIALGANNTLNGGGVLVEYAYIYEPELSDPAIRALTLDEFAYETYRGIEAFVGGTPATADPLLSRRLDQNVPFGTRSNPDVLALEAKLSALGFYPPAGEDGHDCPLTGSFLDCTRQALAAFQNSEGLAPTGALGEATRSKLNERFGS